jgi:hypothetical protein
MPIAVTETIAIFEGVCEIEQAEALLDWLRKTPAPQIDLSQCEHMHTAVLQTLLAVRPTIVAMPPDPLIARILRETASPHHESC